jgi:transposase
MITMVRQALPLHFGDNPCTRVVRVDEACVGKRNKKKFGKHFKHTWIVGLAEVWFLPASYVVDQVYGLLDTRVVGVLLLYLLLATLFTESTWPISRIFGVEAWERRLTSSFKFRANRPHL